MSKRLHWDDKQRSQAQSDWCKMQMVFQSARWCWELLGTAWSNKSDANPPEGDTKPPGGNNSQSLLFSSSIGDQNTSNRLMILPAASLSQKKWEIRIVENWKRCCLLWVKAESHKSVQTANNNTQAITFVSNICSTFLGYIKIGEEGRDYRWAKGDKLRIYNSSTTH